MIVRAVEAATIAAYIGIFLMLAGHFILGGCLLGLALAAGVAIWFYIEDDL